MEETGRTNHFDRDTMELAIEICMRIFDYIKAEENRGFAWQRLGSRQRTRDMTFSLHRLASATAATDQPNESDHVLQAPREGTVQQHKISGVVFRCIRQGNKDTCILERIWDNVDINGIRVDGNVPRDVRLGMAENINVIWFRIIKDWSRLDGNVLSWHILWSGNFTECRRLLQQLENMNTPNSIQIIKEFLHLHCNQRAQYIARHQKHPLAAALSAVDCLPTVIANEELAGEGTLLCAVCLDEISIGRRVKQLPCDHLYHEDCIRRWYYSKLSCPQCRNEISS